MNRATRQAQRVCRLACTCQLWSGSQCTKLRPGKMRGKMPFCSHRKAHSCHDTTKTL
ncbi:hypothetical protein BGW80DRAFT_1316661 [Lactifluus volemus]|nr:hypothetical protein BGW80DRAFT_1316661 [Lactifluus volemus]